MREHLHLRIVGGQSRRDALAARAEALRRTAARCKRDFGKVSRALDALAVERPGASPEKLEVAVRDALGELAGAWSELMKLRDEATRISPP